jgi:hypothetical protein
MIEYLCVLLVGNGVVLLVNIFFLLERPSLFAICNNTFSKWWEGWRMACRRVLSSTPLLVRGSETGGDSGELVNMWHWRGMRQPWKLRVRMQWTFSQITGYVVWTVFPSSQQLRWLSLTDEIVFLKDHEYQLVPLVHPCLWWASQRAILPEV